MREWAEGTGQVHFHFVPTSSSWLNLVERFFSTLTQKRIRRGVFHSVPHLESCLKQYIETYNNRLTSLPSLTHPGDDRSGHNVHSVRFGEFLKQSGKLRSDLGPELESHQIPQCGHRALLPTLVIPTAVTRLSGGRPDVPSRPAIDTVAATRRPAGQARGSGTR